MRTIANGVGDIALEFGIKAKWDSQALAPPERMCARVRNQGKATRLRKATARRDRIMPSRLLGERLGFDTAFNAR
jgi:hypothetical protein